MSASRPRGGGGPTFAPQDRSKARTAPPRGAAKPRSGERGGPTFASRVIAWQRVHGRRDLPWQRGDSTNHAYRVWLSEIMLQQTQVATVIPYFERFVAAFPDVKALAHASIDNVLAVWSGLGYYRRAHHLHQAAQKIVAEHRGEFPRDAATLATLPGVGRSTAAAIAAFSQGEHVAILDGNVKRVLARHRAIDGFPGAPKVAAKLWAVADALLPPVRAAGPPQGANGVPSAAQRRAWGFTSDIAAYTQGMMDLGATICTRANPRCDDCPVQRDCRARRENRVDELPAPRPRKALPHRDVRVLLFECRGEILLEKRPPLGIWGGLWSLPEIALDDDARAFALRRFDAEATVRADLAPIQHGFTHFALTLHPQRIDVASWPSRAEMPSYVWLTRDDALNAALPSPIRKLLRSL